MTKEGDEVTEQLRGIMAFVAVTDAGLETMGAEIDRLRLHNSALMDALRKTALVKTYKRDGKGGSEFIRAECEICEAFCGPDQMITHVGDCPLTILNPLP